MNHDVFKEKNIGEKVLKESQKTSAADIMHSSTAYLNYIAATDNIVDVRENNDRQREEQRRATEILDSIKFDGDIDLDREKSREQLGFRNYFSEQKKESMLHPEHPYQTERYSAEKIEQTSYEMLQFGSIEVVTSAENRRVADTATTTRAAKSIIKPDSIEPIGSVIVKESNVPQNKSWPAYQAERYQSESIEKKEYLKDARYGSIEKIPSKRAIIGGIAGTATITADTRSIIKPDLAGVAGAAAIKDIFRDDTLSLKVKGKDSEVFANQINNTPEKNMKKPGLFKTIGKIAVRETVATIGYGGDDLSDKVKGQATKYGYKTGKYAAISGIAFTKATYGLAKNALQKRKDAAEKIVKAQNSATKKLIKEQTRSDKKFGIAQIIKKDIIEEIEDFRGSDDLGIQAIRAPKDIYLKGKRTIQSIKATSNATHKVVRGSVQAAKKTTNTVKAVARGVKDSAVKVLGSKIGVVAASIIFVIVIIVAFVNGIIPNITLKSDSKEMTYTFEHITKLDAELTETIRSISNNDSNIDEFHYYFNGSSVSGSDITIYTNADYILMYLDTKYDDYSSDKAIYGLFGGTNIKDEIIAIHNALHSYSTYIWKEEVERSETVTDPKTGKPTTKTWIETIRHMDINVASQSFENYLNDNLSTMLSNDEQERFKILLDVGCYTALAELANPFGSDGYNVSSRWGWRIHPISGEVKKHAGLDIPKPEGTPIQNVMAGTVSSVGYSATGLGNYCRVKSADGKREVVYGHMLSVAVSQGQTINQTDIIGYVGTTGQSTGNHLHLEYYIENGFNTNPAFFIKNTIQ